MPDNVIESVVDLERQLLVLYRELSALCDFEDEASPQAEAFDELTARLKAQALTTIDDIRYLVAHMDKSNTDKACLILLLAIGFAGEVRASENAREQTVSESSQPYTSRSSPDDGPRQDL